MSGLRSILDKLAYDAQNFHGRSCDELVTEAEAEIQKELGHCQHVLTEENIYAALDYQNTVREKLEPYEKEMIVTKILNRQAVSSPDPRDITNNPDPLLHALHSHRGMAKVVRDVKCVRGFGRDLKAGEIVVVGGTTWDSCSGNYTVSVDAECGFYDYKAFEPISEQGG
jgi:hypothetical protein